MKVKQKKGNFGSSKSQACYDPCPYISIHTVCVCVHACGAE